MRCRTREGGRGFHTEDRGPLRRDHAAPMPYERDNIMWLAPYTPGEQPTGRAIKLNTNENPYPPSDAVMEAIRNVSAEQLRRYPVPDARPFREAAAKVHGVTREHIIATNGGDELLRLAISVFCDVGQGGAGGGVGVCEPSYSLYPVLAAIHDTPVTAVELDGDFALPADTASQWNDAGCRLGMIVNPHAPSGRLQPLDTLRTIAEEFRGVLLIDEAYVDFAPHDALGLVREGLDNVLLLRTLSKGYSLAGLRFGYGLGHPDLIAALDKARDSYNTDALSQAAAVAAIQHREAAATTWRRVIAERERLAVALRRLGFGVLPSASNFLLVTPPTTPTPLTAGLDAESLYRSLKSRDILVRWFDQPRLWERLRITVGTVEQDEALLGALGESIEG